MKRPLQNFAVNFVALGLFLFLATTGLLMRYLLPPGSHGVGIWGLGRHDWGAVHFWIAVAMLSTIAVHLLLHGRWIIHMIRGRKASTRRERLRLAAGGAILVLLVGSASAPLLGTKVAVTADSPEEAASGSPADGEARYGGSELQVEGEIRGHMTLFEIEQQTGVTVASLVLALRLPPDVPSTVPLKSLADAYGFDVHAVRELVARRSTGVPQANGSP